MGFSKSKVSLVGGLDWWLDRLVPEARWGIPPVPNCETSSEAELWVSNLALVVKTVLGSHSGVGEFTTHFGPCQWLDWLM